MPRPWASMRRGRRAVSLRPEFEEQRHTLARGMRKIKGFLARAAERHRYTIMQNFLDNTGVTRVACRYVSANDPTSQPRRLHRRVLPTRRDPLGPGEAPPDRPHHPQLRPGGHTGPRCPPPPRPQYHPRL